MEHNLSMGRFHRVSRDRRPAYLPASTFVRFGCPLRVCCGSIASGGAAEDVDVAGLEDLGVAVARIELGDEGGDVADRRAVVAVQAVEDDVLGLGVAAVADPEGVGAGGE